MHDAQRMQVLEHEDHVSNVEAAVLEAHAPRLYFYSSLLVRLWRVVVISAVSAWW
jgi:hypothetical protein